MFKNEAKKKYVVLCVRAVSIRPPLLPALCLLLPCEDVLKYGQAYEPFGEEGQNWHVL